MGARSNRVQAVASAGVLTAAAAMVLSGCGHDSSSVYCADAQGRVFDSNRCDHTTGFIGESPYYYYVGGFGGHTYSPGQRIAQQYLSGSSAATRVSPTDSAARAKAGLPKTGTVKSGTVVKGGIGSGGVKAGSGAKAGSAGG